MINKNELNARLKQGELLGDIFNFTDGQECLIYKGKFEKSDNIIYIPDIYLNELETDTVVEDEEDLNNILKNCYTGNDFLKECNGCEKAARALFGFVNWQHPNIQDLVDLYDDEEDEFFKEFGIHFEDVCTKKEKNLFAISIVKKYLKEMNPTFWNGQSNIPDTFDSHPWQYPLTENISLEITCDYDDEEKVWKHYCDLINSSDDSSFDVLSGVGINDVLSIANTIIDLCNTHKELVFMNEERIANILFNMSLDMDYDMFVDDYKEDMKMLTESVGKLSKTDDPLFYVLQTIAGQHEDEENLLVDGDGDFVER